MASMFNPNGDLPFWEQVFMAQHYGGMSAYAAIDAVERKTGDTGEAELMRKSRTVGDIMAAFGKAGSLVSKRELRRKVLERVDELYGDDMLCEEHQDMIRRNAEAVVPIGKRSPRNYSFNQEHCAWYEVSQKWIMKSGCDKCPWNQREEAKWRQAVAAKKKEKEEEEQRHSS